MALGTPAVSLRVFQERGEAEEHCSSASG
jgi:hypothetical protein